MRIVRWIAVAAGALLLLVVIVIAALLYYVSTDSFNRTVAGRAGEMTHRKVAIDGNIDIHWGRITRVVLSQVKIGNADWGSSPTMGSADRIEFTINLPALLHGNVVLPELTIVGPQLLLERNDKGQSNWDFSTNPAAATAAEATSPDKRGDLPIIGRLAIHEARLTFRNPVRGIDSDLAGNLTLETGGRRPHLSADLVSQRLDFDDLAGFIGATPATGPGEAANAEQKQEAKKEKQDQRVLPDEKVDLVRLRATDMKIALTGKEVIAQKLPMEDFNATFLLDDGLLTVEPLAFGAADGRIAGSVVLNGREKVPVVSGDLQLSQLQLAKFFGNSDLAKEMGGTFGGHFALQGHGRSIAEILANSNGKVVLTMSGGKMSSHLLERVGGDIAESLGFRLTKDKPVKIRCAVADFDLQSGDLKAKTLVLDTTDTNVTGEGHIDLGSEKLDLKLNAHPKDPSLLAARTPVLIKGTLSDPKFGVDPSGVIGGAAAAVLSVFLAPIAVLLPMIELGLGKDSPCNELIREAQTSN